MKLTKLKIGTRLYLGFGAVIILLLFTACVGVGGLAVIDGMFNKAVQDLYPQATRVNTAINELNVIARAMRNTLLTPDQDVVKKELARINASKTVIEESLDKFGKSITNDKSREFFKDVMNAREKYIVVQNRFMQLQVEGKTDEAKAFLFGDMRTHQNAFFDNLRKLGEFQGSLMEQAKQDGNELYQSTRKGIIALAGLAILAAIVITFLVVRFLLKQLGGEPAYAVWIAGQIASGDLSVDIATQPNDQTSLLFALKRMRHDLGSLIARVQTSTELIGTASNQIAGGNLDLSSRTEQQASSLEETASSMEELTSTVKQNTDNAHQANQFANTASAVAVKAGDAMSKVVNTMGTINESSKKIADIISVIDGIAFQTNILALNAAVEAARAGEQGRGFAVVASEVRNLAQRSASASKEIKTLIVDSVDKVKLGSQLVNEAGVTMNEVVESVKRVTDIIQEISAASNEQSSGLEQINQAIIQMDGVTQQNAALVEEAAAASQSLHEQASNLSLIVGTFKLSQETVRQASIKPPSVNSIGEKRIAIGM